MSASGQIEQIKRSMRNAWMAGDFGEVAKTIASGAEAFVQRLGIPAGARVLDVACGTGNVAIPLARAGCLVTGVDIAPNLIAQGRHRATVEGVSVHFDEGDAEELPYGDGDFDAVVTMFGAMFAPQPKVVAAELARVLRSGGLLAMANWNPESFSGAMFETTHQHVPAPPGIVPPVLWGNKEIVRERLAPFFVQVQTDITPIEFDLPVNPSGVVAFFRKYFGPTQVAFSRLDEAGQQALASDLESLWASANVASDPANQTRIHNEYLQVTAVRR